MKIILVVLAVVALWWLLRASLRPRERPPNAASSVETPTQAMLVCAHCGVHLPRDEVLPGRGGVFCGAAHRAAFEQAHPGP